MTMATLQFFRNGYYYPHYTEKLTSYGSPMECTPVGLNLRNGTLRIRGNMDDFMSCNYLALTREGHTLYAWIDDVKFRTEDSFDITYSVDAWRTYKDKINLGVQYIERHPTPTNQLDPLLGAEQDYPDVESHVIKNVSSNERIFVVQVRPAQGEIFSNTPVQPTPYQFYMTNYKVNNWADNKQLQQLLSALEGGAETENIVTMYSIPYMELHDLVDRELPVRHSGGETTKISGWKMLGVYGEEDPNSRLFLQTNIFFYGDLYDLDREALLRVNHSVQIVIPEAGIIDIPDYLLMKDDLQLRQDIDLFSGASNYMLMTGSEELGTAEYYTQSVRGSSVSSIPILSDPMDTYMSQNQNALTTSLMGDVATIGASLAMFTPQGRAVGTAMGIGNGMTTGAGLLGAYSGVNSIMDRKASTKDAGTKYSNPPSFLGTALAGNFNNRFWLVITKDPVDNATDVHTNYGYQYGKLTKLTLPNQGFIKTEGCNVMATEGNVPRWALQEINAIFDNGIQVH